MSKGSYCQITESLTIYILSNVRNIEYPSSSTAEVMIKLIELCNKICWHPFDSKFIFCLRLSQVPPTATNFPPSENMEMLNISNFFYLGYQFPKISEGYSAKRKEWFNKNGRESNWQYTRYIGGILWQISRGFII